MGKFYYLIALLCISLRSLSGSPSPASATVDLSIVFSSKPGPDANTLAIPIKRANNLIVIEAKIDSVIGNFILDTGSPYLVLNKTYFRKFWQPDNLYASNAANNSVEPILRTSVHNLAIRELVFSKLSADVSDLGHIENHRGLKILGLLGVNLFTSFEMVIDLNKDVLYLRKQHKDVKEEPNSIVTSTPITTIPFRLSQNIITMDVTIAGKKLIFCLDTGAETSALSNQAPKKVMETFELSKRMVMLGTGGSKAEVLLGTIHEITIGTKSFKKMHTAITRLDALGNGYGRHIDGILGNNFLVKGIVSINFAKRELSLYPYAAGTP